LVPPVLVVCLSIIYAFFWGKNGLPRHHPGAFARIDMESRGVWQQLFLFFLRGELAFFPVRWRNSPKTVPAWDKGVCPVLPELPGLGLRCDGTRAAEHGFDL
jgi:hypothetical protein